MNGYLDYFQSDLRCTSLVGINQR